MTDYNDGKWHGWNGGECPVHPKSRVQWMRYTGMGMGRSYQGETPGQVVDWNDTPNSEKRIDAFRVTKPYREPREWWLTICGGYTHAHATMSDAETYVRCNSKSDVAVVHVREVME